MNEFIEDENYNDNHNCQTFISKALNSLRSLFNPNMIIESDILRKKENKIDAFPTFIQGVLNILKKLLNHYTTKKKNYFLFFLNKLTLGLGIRPNPQ
jgi:hypothetical protein